MIRARFRSGKDGTLGFELSGHSGYAEEGSDIVCAAVSAMAGLVIHIAADIYEDGGKIYQDEKTAELSFYPEKTISGPLVEGLFDHIAALSEEYPEYVSVERI